MGAPGHGRRKGAGKEGGDMKERPIADPKFCPAGRIICRGCGWNADGGPCGNCGATAPARDFEVQAWRELWGVQ